jgi:hypothetical protein
MSSSTSVYSCLWALSRVRKKKSVLHPKIFMSVSYPQNDVALKDGWLHPEVLIF